MKTFKRSLIFMTAFVMLFLLSGKQLRAAEVLEPVEISSPLEVEENIKQDVGMFAQHDGSDTTLYHYNPYYYKVNVEERGYLVIRGLAKRLNDFGTTNTMILWENASMTSGVDGKARINMVDNIYYIFYLDPGTYYVEMRAGFVIQTCYAYFMPSSNVLSVSVNSLPGKAELSVTTTVPQASIQWVENDSTNTNIWDEKFYANKTAENTIEVKENGTYYVRVSSTNNDWKDFPVDVVFDVTGITAPTPTPTVKPTVKPTLKPTATTTPGKKLSDTVTVKKITSTVTLKKGKTVKSTSKFKIYDKTKVSKVTYKTSNKKIASVSKSGKIKGVKKGTATITVTVAFKDKSTKKLTFKVKVK